MRAVTAALFLVVGVSVVGSSACDKKSSPPPSQTTTDGGGGTDAGVDGGGGTDAGVGIDAGQDGGYCIRQNCTGDLDCMGLGPDGGNLNCVTLPTPGSGDVCQRVCSNGGGTCPNGTVCRNGRCAEADCTSAACNISGFACRSFSTPTALCLPPCGAPEECCGENDVDCLANIDCVNTRCTPKTCTQSACDALDAGFTCISYVSTFPTSTCTSSCDNSAQCAAAAAQASQTDPYVCQ